MTLPVRHRCSPSVATTAAADFGTNHAIEPIPLPYSFEAVPRLAAVLPPCAYDRCAGFPYQPKSPPVSVGGGALRPALSLPRARARPWVAPATGEAPVAAARRAGSR